MGNTGSFMVRWRQYKFIAFGTAFSTFKDYKAPLFDISADPGKMHDLSASLPGVVKDMRPN